MDDSQPGYRPDHKDARAMEPRPVPEKRQSDDDLLRTARERAVYAQDWWRENHNLAAQDVTFVEGEQWGAADLADREGVPSLVMNGLAAYVEQVTGEQRQNRPAIHVRAADDYGAAQEYTVGDGKTTRRVKGAELYSGIIRAIEFNSGAEAQYDAVHRHAVDGAMGFLRVVTRYANGRDFDQELLIKRVKNRWSVLLDPDAEEPDFSDAMYAFVIKDMPRSEFLRRYPKARVGSLVDTLDAHERAFWSASEAKERITEYITREPVERELLLFSNGQMSYLDEVEDVVDDLEMQGVTVVRRRKVIDWRIRWRLITAWSVLEGPVDLPFKSIPIIPTFGRERNMPDNRTVYSSLIRHAKDPSRMSNYWWSAATQRISNASKAQWVASAEAIAGHENDWARANEGTGPAVLTYNEGSEQPRREPPPPMPVAEVSMAQQMTGLVRDTIGMGSPGMSDMPGDASGKALRTRQAVASTGTFVFTDNLSLAMRRIGLLLVQAIPRIYDTERVVTLLGEDRQSATWAKVNEVVVDQETGREVVINSLGSGEFDVYVTTGPTYASMREQAVEGQMQLMQIAPNLAPMFADKAVENMDWPQANQIAERIRRGMPPQILSPEERKELADEMASEQGPQGPQGPSPEQQQAMAAQAQMQQQAAMQAEIDQRKIAIEDAKVQAQNARTEAERASARAKIEKAMADIEKARADMLEAQARASVAQVMPVQNGRQ